MTQQVDDQFKQLLKSENDYDDLIGIFVTYFTEDDEQYYNDKISKVKKLANRIFKTINALLTGKKHPTRFYLSARLVKDLMLLDLDKFQELCSIEILPTYSIILSQFANNSVEEIVPQYFSQVNEKDRLVAQKYFQVMLESVQFWAQLQINNIIFKFYSQQDIELASNQRSFESPKKSNPNQRLGMDQSQSQQFQNDHLMEESKTQENNNGYQQNPLFKAVKAYEMFKLQIEQAVDSYRGSERELKVFLLKLEPSVKQYLDYVEADIQKCLGEQELDPNLDTIMEALFEYQTYYMALEQDIENMKQGIFEPQVFFKKYGSLNPRIPDNQQQRQVVLHQDGTPTPQNNNSPSSNKNIQQSFQHQQNKQIELNLINEEQDEEFSNLAQSMQNQKTQQHIQQSQNLLNPQKDSSQQLQSTSHQQSSQLNIPNQQTSQLNLPQQQRSQLNISQQQQSQQNISQQQQSQQNIPQQQQSQQNVSQQQLSHSSMKLSDINKAKQAQKQQSQQELLDEQIQMQIKQNQMRNEEDKLNFIEQNNGIRIGSKEQFQEEDDDSDQEEIYDFDHEEQQRINNVLVTPSKQQIQNSKLHAKSASAASKQFSKQIQNGQQYQDLSEDKQIKTTNEDQSRLGNQSEIQEKSFKSFTNDSYKNKHYLSMIVKSNSQSKFTKTINENAEKYIQPYASSKIGFNQSAINIDRNEQQKSLGPEKKKPVFTEKEKFKDIKQENINLSSQVKELQSNIKMLSGGDQNQFIQTQNNLYQLVELKNQNEENRKRVDSQNEIILRLQNSLINVQDENQRLKSQGSQMIKSDTDTEYLKSQIQKLQSDYDSLLHASQPGNNSKTENIQQHPQYQALLKQNDELNSKISQITATNQPSFFQNLNNHSNLQFNSSIIPSVRGRPESAQLKQQSMSSSKRYQSPKIFQEFKPRGSHDQGFRQSVDSLNRQGVQTQNNKSSVFLTSTNNQQFSSQSNGIHQISSNPVQELNNQFCSPTNRVASNTFPSGDNSNNLKSKHKPIFSQPQKNIIRKTFDSSPQSQIANNRQSDTFSQNNGSEIQNNKQKMRYFNTPPQLPIGRLSINNGLNTNNNTSLKKLLDGAGDMRDISHIPSTIYNDKREEIESIQKNNQSTHSYSESVREILNPLTTKNNIQIDNNIVTKNENKDRLLNFSYLKEGEQVQFNKNIFSLIMQYVNKLNRFKASCLKSKYPIYEDSQVQIGAVTQHQHQNSRSDSRNRLKAIKKARDSDIIHLDAIQSMFYKHKLQVNTYIIQQRILNKINNQNISGVSPIYLGLPNTVNKMFIYKEINKDLFKRQYKERKHIKYILIPECNTKFAKTHQDFKMHLDKLVDLNPESEFEHMQGTSKFKMGLLFSLDQAHTELNEDFLMKIVCNQDHSAHVFIAFNDFNSNEKVNFILNTFCFLFSANLD